MLKHVSMWEESLRTHGYSHGLRAVDVFHRKCVPIQGLFDAQPELFLFK